MNDCSPVIESRARVAARGNAKCRPGPNVGKADALWEETGKCTTETAGVGVQASKERFAEITSGRSRDQQWVVQAASTVNEPKAQLMGGHGTGDPSGRSSEEERVEPLERRTCGYAALPY